MSEFRCTVERLRVEPHPNADKLELALVGDYRSVVQKGQFKTGDLGVYIPEQAVLPPWLTREMGLEGKLAGKDKNRVKAIRLRGVVSQGLIYPVHPDSFGNRHFIWLGKINSDPWIATIIVKEGQDVTRELGVTKYEPPLPIHLQGKHAGVDLEATIAYDIENIKRIPDLFTTGEEVVITEKLHGTFCLVGLVPPSMGKDKYWNGVGIVSSKGLAAKGIILDASDEGNLYVRTALQEKLWERLVRGGGESVRRTGQPVMVLGEIFGDGVQDLHYGLTGRVTFRAFDIWIGTRSQGQFLNEVELNYHLYLFGIERVPVLYRGAYDREILNSLTSGKSFFSSEHIKEGVVIKSVDETPHPDHGRKIAKSISEDYLFRKGGTEFN